MNEWSSDQGRLPVRPVQRAVLAALVAIQLLGEADIAAVSAMTGLTRTEVELLRLALEWRQTLAKA
jgi:hypothetical protein